MLLDIWNYFRGYVIIEVSGFSVERFVNLAVHKGVYIWDITYHGSKVSMKVSVKGFKKLKDCAKKTKCRFKIVEKKGYPFVAYRYRKRKIFVGGFLFFILVLYGLSSFIWLIEIEGNSRIEYGDIMDFCTERGFKLGAYKHSVKKRELEQEMIHTFSDISFLNISVKGTKATITLTETIPKQEIVDRETPCDIIAKKDGIIMSIYTSAGTPQVKPKDVVSEGDILVSGQLEVLEDDTGQIYEYVHSDAQIRAKLYYYIKFDVSKKYTEKVFTGNTKNRYRLNLFNKDFNLFNYSIPYTNYDKITRRTQFRLGENYPLPIILITEEYNEYTPVERERSLEQMKELAGIMVTNRIIREFDFEADVTEKIIRFTEEDHGININATIITVEDIGEEVPVNVVLPMEEEEIPDEIDVSGV